MCNLQLCKVSNHWLWRPLYSGLWILFLIPTDDGKPLQIANFRGFSDIGIEYFKKIDQMHESF
jgi:hypothetical protein